MEEHQKVLNKKRIFSELDDTRYQQFNKSSVILTTFEQNSIMAQINVIEGIKL